MRIFVSSSDENSLDPEKQKEFEDDYACLYQFMREDHIEEKNKMKELFSTCITNRTSMFDEHLQKTGFGLYLK